MYKLEGFKTPTVLPSSRQPWTDHSKRMGVRPRLSPPGFIFDSRRKGGSRAAHSAIAKPAEPRKGRNHKARRVNAGNDAPPTKEAQPRKGRNHKARRVNAGNDGSPRKKLSPARGDIIKPGVSTSGMMGPHERIRAPPGAKS